MSQEITKNVPLVCVQVGFGADKDILHWEGTLDQFNYIYQQGLSIRFPRHQSRVVHTSKIVDHWPLVSESSLTIESLLSTLSDTDKKTVQGWVREIPRKTGKEANVEKVQNMIKKLQGQREPEEISQNKKLSDLERFKTKLQINRGLIAKQITGRPWGFNNLKTK